MAGKQKQNDNAAYTAAFALLLITVGAQLFTGQSVAERALTVVSIFIIAICMGFTLKRSSTDK